MEIVLILFSVQGFIGAFDNLWHHEITENLTKRPEARPELKLHTIREFIYGIIFCSLAWVNWQGYWALLLLALLTIEIVVTLWDFVIEDQTRKLPAFERVLHTILAINFGVILAMFLPEIANWFYLPTEFSRVNYGILSWIMMAYGVGVSLWGMYDLFALQRLAVPEWKRVPIFRETKADTKTILVTGATGFIGQSTIRALLKRGENIIVLSRSKDKADYLFGDHVKIVTRLSEIKSSETIDTIINLAGESVMGGLWTKKRKEKLLASRLNITEDLVKLSARLICPPKTLLSGSAIGYYGNRKDEELSERDAPQSIFMSELCQKWEAVALEAEKLGIRVCTLRTGLVFNHKGGAFEAMARPIKFGLGAVLGSGMQRMSWIHLKDMVRVILFAIDHTTISGPINTTAPNSITNKEFTQLVAKNASRPVFFRIPIRPLKLLLGEMADLFIEGQNVKPSRLLKHGFEFLYPTFEKALPELLEQKEFQQLAPLDHSFYYNDKCPICSFEINQYEKFCNTQKLEVKFLGLEHSVKDLAKFSLTRNDLKRRVYVMNSAGQLSAGVDAFKEITAGMPYYRWVSKMLHNTVIHRIVEFIYEGILAPSLYEWSNHRENNTNQKRNSRAVRKR